MSFKKILAGWVLLCLCFVADAQLQIVPQTNAQALAQKLVGPGITISNVSVTGSNLSTAFFYNQGGTQLGVDSGIVLSTGRVLTEGATIGLNGNAISLASSNTFSPGDPALSALVAPRPTNNAVVLEFDFVPVGDSVKFRYVFSSDEYPNYNCSNFNDVFAFFINGPGITGTKNIALVPGTNIPVSINSINNGIPGGGGTIANCNSMGPGSPFVQYYINNAVNQYFSHNGHTVVLEARAAVQPCQVYHLKIAIADVQDNSFDSGVFLEAESLRSDPISIVNENPEINGQAYLVEGCQTGGIKIMRSKKSPFAQPVNIVVGGTAINGTDVETLPGIATIAANDSFVFVPIVPVVDNVAEGIEILKIYISNGCILSNTYVDSIEVQIRDYDTLAMNPEGAVGMCNNGSVQLNALGAYVKYQWFPGTNLNNPNIPNPIASPLSDQIYICKAIVGDCNAEDSIKIAIKRLEFISKKDVNCKNGTTGEIRVSGGWEWRAPVMFSIDNGAYGPDSTFTGLTAGNHVVKIKDATGCIDSVEVTLAQTFPDLLLTDSIVNASCVGTNGQVILSAAGGKPSYSFAIDNSAYTVDPAFTVTGGNHTVSVKDENGCVTSYNLVVDNDPAILLNTFELPASCSGAPDGVIYVEASGGSGNYQYSIDGTNFQVPDSFFVNAGNVLVTVKDNKGCTANINVNVPLFSDAFVNAGNDTTICEGSSVQLNTSSNAGIFTWAANPGLSNINIKDPIASPVVTSAFFLTAVKGICTVKDTITINVLPAPVANAGIDSSICVGRSIILNGSGGVAYSWLPASQVSDPHIPNPTVRPSQSSNFYLQVTSSDGCPSLQYDTVRISLVPAVKAFAGRDTSVTVGQPLQLHGMELGNSGVTKFRWSPALGLNDPNIFNPVATLDRDMTYQVLMTTPQGCEGSDYINIKVYKGPEIYVPSAFSPNDDGKNDLLKAIPVGMKSLHFFRVFNRWGQMVFSTTIESRGWDGRINGVKQGTGTFVWIAEGVDYKGNLITRKGSTTLIR